MKHVIMSERAKQANFQKLAGWMLEVNEPSQKGMDGFQDSFCQLVEQLLSCPDENAIRRGGIVHYMANLYYRRLVALGLLEISNWDMKRQVNTMTKSILKHGNISHDAFRRGVTA